MTNQELICLDMWIKHYRMEMELYRTSLVDCLKRKIEHLCEVEGVSGFESRTDEDGYPWIHFEEKRSKELNRLAREMSEFDKFVEYQHPGMWK